MPQTPTAAKSSPKASHSDPSSSSFGKRPFAPSDRSRIQHALEKNSQLPSAAAVIQEANKVFGFNGWSASISNVWAHDRKATQDNDDDKIVAYASAAVRVLLRDGTCREGMGFAQGRHSNKYGADYLAKNAAVQDAIRHALRAFGPLFDVRDKKSSK